MLAMMSFWNVLVVALTSIIPIQKGCYHWLAVAVVAAVGAAVAAVVEVGVTGVWWS
jgi:hypothetical protein